MAAVEIAVRPSDQFEIVNEVPLSEELVSLKFPDYVIYGFLDVAMASDSIDIDKMRLAVRSVKIDSAGSSAYALREAGRDAARKIVQILKIAPSISPSEKC